MNPKTYFTPANGYNPRGAQRYGKASVNSVKFSVDNVWGAACAAHRINNGYHKDFLYKVNENGGTEIVQKRNRDIMMELLENPALLTVEDIAQGQECRKYLQHDLTFRAVKGKLTDFDKSVSRTLAIQEEFDSNQNRLELAIVACLPQNHQRSLARASSDEKLVNCEPIDAPLNDKVNLTVEVVRSNYSQKFNIFWVTAIAETNRAVFFSSKEAYDAGTFLDIRGTVKAHHDNKTQLNRVKVL